MCEVSSVPSRCPVLPGAPRPMLSQPPHVTLHLPSCPQVEVAEAPPLRVGTHGTDKGSIGCCIK